MSDYKTVNPATGETVREFPTLDDAGRRAGPRAGSRRASPTWRATPPADRAAVLHRGRARLYDERADELARS